MPRPQTCLCRLFEKSKFEFLRRLFEKRKFECQAAGRQPGKDAPRWQPLIERLNAPGESAPAQPGWRRRRVTN